MISHKIPHSPGASAAGERQTGNTLSEAGIAPTRPPPIPPLLNSQQLCALERPHGRSECERATTDRMPVPPGAPHRPWKFLSLSFTDGETEAQGRRDLPGVPKRAAAVPGDGRQSSGGSFQPVRSRGQGNHLPKEKGRNPSAWPEPWRTHCGSRPRWTWSREQLSVCPSIPGAPSHSLSSRCVSLCLPGGPAAAWCLCQA